METTWAGTADTMVSFGGNIKALEQQGDVVTVGGTGILFGDAAMPDLVGDWFTPRTYLGAHGGRGVDTMLHHGIPLRPELAVYADTLLPPVVKAETDARGLLVATVLDLRDSYQRTVYEMVEADLLSWSSGAPPHGVKRRDNAPRGEITRWLISEFSYTPTPCEPRLSHIMPLKSLLKGDEATTMTTDILALLKDGSRAGLTFSDHGAAVLAAAEGFRGRLFDWYQDRSASRKSGRVFSAGNWTRLDELCVSLGLTYGAMRALLDAHQPEMPTEPILDDAVLQAQIRFAALAARLYGVAV